MSKKKKKKKGNPFTYKFGKTDITGNTADQELMKLVKRDHTCRWVYLFVSLPVTGGTIRLIEYLFNRFF